jgi:hypothetical protein
LLEAKRIEEAQERKRWGIEREWVGGGKKGGLKIGFLLLVRRFRVDYG